MKFYTLVMDLVRLLFGRLSCRRDQISHTEYIHQSKVDEVFLSGINSDSLGSILPLVRARWEKKGEGLAGYGRSRGERAWGGD